MTTGSQSPPPEELRSENEVPNLPMALPNIPREALQRIAQAEETAKEHYDQDKVPYFPTSPQFSFLEDSIFLSIRRILGYVQVFAEQVLNASLEEYLTSAPAELLTNATLLQSIAENTISQAGFLWEGYGCILAAEPSTRKAQMSCRIADGTINEHPELEPWRYPAEEPWARFLARMAEPDSEMARLNSQYDSTIKQVIENRLRHYQSLAIARLRLECQANPQAVPSDADDGAAKAESELTAAAQTDALTWQDIEIRFVTDHDVQLFMKGESDRRNYAQLGFEDRRTGSMSLAWMTLQHLAKEGGEIRLDTIQGRKRAKVEKRIQEIRRHLRRHFRLDHDPLPFLPGTGYKAAFRIVWSQAAGS